MKAIIYTQRGKILRVVSCPESMMAMQPRDGELFMPVPDSFDVDDARHYVSVDSRMSAVMSKAELDVDFRVDGLTLELLNLPEGMCFKSMHEDVVGVSDGDDAIEFETPGRKRIRFYDHPAYHDKEIEVTIHG